MREPAAPYPEPGWAVPKYIPNAVFPRTNNNDVKNAPIQTNLHFIYASGKNLNISANKTVIIARENTILSI